MNVWIGLLIAVTVAAYCGIKDAIFYRRTTNRHTDMMNKIVGANRRLSRQNRKLRARIAHIQLKRTLGV